MNVSDKIVPAKADPEHSDADEGSAVWLPYKEAPNFERLVKTRGGPAASFALGYTRSYAHEAIRNNKVRLSSELAAAAVLGDDKIEKEAAGVFVAKVPPNKRVAITTFFDALGLDYMEVRPDE